MTTVQNVFKILKKEIASERTLIHYNSKLPLTLATDASPVGLGGVLSHIMPDGTERPIAFASRSLSKSEKKYSQIDKEATGIYWALKKFFLYCYGRKFASGFNFQSFKTLTIHDSHMSLCPFFIRF